MCDELTLDQARRIGYDPDQPLRYTWDCPDRVLSEAVLRQRERRARRRAELAMTPLLPGLEATHG